MTSVSPIARLLTLLALALGSCIALSMGSERGAEALPTSAIDDFGACLAAAREGDLLVLIDESGSLEDTDPQAARVSAASYLLDQLATFTTTSGVALDVSIAGFASSYAESIGWTPLDAANLPGLQSVLESFRGKDNGFETDYWVALEGARSALATRQPAGELETRCQAIAWFTDGQLAISTRTTQEQRDRYGTTKPYAPGLEISTREAAEAADGLAAESICRAGGLADQIRSAGIVTFAVGLTPDSSAGAQFDLLRSIATGEPVGGTPCGQVQIPRPGEFQLASDIDSLLFAFDRLSTPGQPPIEAEAGICQGSPCELGRHAFVLDTSISAVHILGSVDRTGINAQLILPSGAAVELGVRTRGQTTALTQDGVSVSYRWLSERSVTVDLVNAEQSPLWSGLWALVFIDPASASPEGVSRSNIHITGDLFPARVDESTAVLHTGEVAQGIVLGLVNAAGQPIDPLGILGQLELDVEVRARDGTTVSVASNLTKSELGPIDVDLTDISPGPAVLRLILSVTTAGVTAFDGTAYPGTTLEPQVVDVPLQIATPVGFPQVGPGINFGSADGVVVLVAELPVEGPGCVWVDGDGNLAVSASPDGVSDIALRAPSATSAESCLTLDEGRSGSLPLELSYGAQGNGAVNGSFELTIAPAGEIDRATQVTVTFTAELQKTINTGNFALALIAALLLGPGIPIGLLFLSKWYTGRIPPIGLSARRIEVTVESGQVLREGLPFALHDRDFVNGVPIPEQGARRLSIDGVELQTKTGWSPFGAAYVVVRSPGQIGASSEIPASHGKSLDARLPLAVHNTWVVLCDPRGDIQAASVLILVNSTASLDQRQSLADSVTGRLPDVLDALRAKAAAAGLTSEPSELAASSAAAGRDPFGARGDDPGSTRGHDPFGD